MDHFFFGTYIFGSYFSMDCFLFGTYIFGLYCFHTNWWIISFEDLHFWIFQHKFMDQYGVVLALCVIVATHCIIFLDDELVDHLHAWMVRETVDHFARESGGGMG